MDARIGFSAGPVGGGDAGAVEPHGGRGDLFGALGEVGGDRGGIGWHELGAAIGCPAVPAFPAAVVDAVGVLGGGGFERGGDPGVIDGGDAGDLAPVDGGDGQEAAGPTATGGTSRPTSATATAAGVRPRRRPRRRRSPPSRARHPPGHGGGYGSPLSADARPTIETTTTRTRRASRRGSPTDSAACGRPTTGRGLTVSASPTSSTSSPYPRLTTPGCAPRAPPCAARFASDLDNLTLATPALNRYQKRDHDAAEWLPTHNRCWFAATIVAVRREYDLTIDRREAAALDAVLKGCDD